MRPSLRGKKLIPHWLTWTESVEYPLVLGLLSIETFGKVISNEKKLYFGQARQVISYLRHFSSSH